MAAVYRYRIFRPTAPGTAWARATDDLALHNKSVDIYSIAGMADARRCGAPLSLVDGKGDSDR